MRAIRTRKSDATFDLNLAPFLDIIVSVIPMLLLSVAFIQIKMIETPIPQVVAEKIANANDKPVSVTLALTADLKRGYVIEVNENGKINKQTIPMKDGKLDYEALAASATALKLKYTDVFKMDFSPSATVSYNDIVSTMDSLRRLPSGQKVSFKDDKTGEPVETDLMFPDVTFSNILGDTNG